MAFAVAVPMGVVRADGRLALAVTLAVALAVVLGAVALAAFLALVSQPNRDDLRHDGSRCSGRTGRTGGSARPDGVAVSEMRG
jgi:hypothetical protein